MAVRKGTRNIIRTGSTRPGYIEADPGLHEGLSFRYMPMLPEEAEELEEATKNLPPQKSIAIVAAALKGKLVEWSEVDEQGNAEQITIDNIRHLPFDVLYRLARIVKGFAKSDLPLGATAEQESDYMAALKAEAEGKTPGTGSVSAELKN